jgi:hypothetical protein
MVPKVAVLLRSGRLVADLLKLQAPGVAERLSSSEGTRIWKESVTCEAAELSVNE